MSIREKVNQLCDYLSKFNTYYVTVDGKTYLCLDFINAGGITFRLGRFNLLCEYLNEDETFDLCDFNADYRDNIITVTNPYKKFVIECYNDPSHTIKKEKFDGDWNLFKEKYTDFKRSYEKDGLYYCVIDLFKIGKLSDKDRKVFESIFDPYGRHAPINIDSPKIDRSGLTLTLCYICNLKTQQVDECVVWDIVNQRAVGKVMFG